MEVSRNWRPSGNAYVAARFEGKLTQLRILNEVTCDHTANICSECARLWEYDYEVLYDNTVGGRALKARMSN